MRRARRAPRPSTSTASQSSRSAPSGAAMSVALDHNALLKYLKRATDVSPDHPVVISKFIESFFWSFLVINSLFSVVIVHGNAHEVSGQTSSTSICGELILRSVVDEKFSNCFWWEHFPFVHVDEMPHVIFL